MPNQPLTTATRLLLAAAFVPAACTTTPHRITADTIEMQLAGGATLLYERGHRTQKPHVRQLRTGAGFALLQDGPAGHEHHHGLMLAFGIGELDFWAERYTDRPGVQREIACTEAVHRPTAGGEWRGFTTQVEWVAPKTGAAVATEQRTLLTAPGTAGPALVTWRSRLAATDATRVWGNPYYGLGLRLAATCDGTVTFTTSDGASGRVVRGDERLTPARWCAAEGPIGGAATTVALFAHPANPRTPTQFFTMGRPFAFLSATLDVAAVPLELAAGETLELTWALALWPGTAARDEIDAAWRTWAAAFTAGPAPVPAR
jgi:hypothetical protein